MTFNAALFDPPEVCLEIPQIARVKAWQQSQSFSTPSSRWNAYLNQICLGAILPWLQEEYNSGTKAWPSAAGLPSFWAVVNGTAIVLETTRFAVIPTETIDLSELYVPQEWADIPGWAPDYYLAVQVNPDDGWVRIWGYTTHWQLKKKATYNALDRTYCLESDDLIRDFSVLWVTRQLGLQEPTRCAIAPLPALSSTQAENLLQRLGNPAILVPRLEVPFEVWGALLQHGGWRQGLYERRQGLPEQRSVVQWLQTQVSELAQQFGWQRLEFQPSLAIARGAELESAVLTRPLIVAGLHCELRIFPQDSSEQPIWRFELRNCSGDPLPKGFKLRLFAEDLQAFENNEDAAITPVDRLYIDVSLSPGEGLVWEIEPLPENYDREILRF